MLSLNLSIILNLLSGGEWSAIMVVTYDDNRVRLKAWTRTLENQNALEPSSSP